MTRRTSAVALAVLVAASTFTLPVPSASAATMPTGAQSLESVNFPVGSSGTWTTSAGSTR